MAGCFLSFLHVIMRMGGTEDTTGGPLAERGLRGDPCGLSPVYLIYLTLIDDVGGDI
jgi:hypothetical protein